MKKILFLMSSLFFFSCESKRMDNLDEIKNKIKSQNSAIDSLQLVIYDRVQNLKDIEKQLEIFQKKIDKIKLYSDSKLSDVESDFLYQKSELESIKVIIDNTLNDFNDLKSSIDKETNDLRRKIEFDNQDNEIISKFFSFPFDSKTTKIDLRPFIGNSSSLFEVVLLSVNDINHKSNSSIIDFQLTITTQLLNKKNVYQNGLVSFYQYSQPEVGIINSVSSTLSVDRLNPYIFLDGNRQYEMTGNLLFKVSGNFR